MAGGVLHPVQQHSGVQEEFAVQKARLLAG